MGFQVIAFPTFQPAVRIISAITNANPAVVTTVFAAGQTNAGNQYETGTIVRLDIPREYGMYEANTLFASITVINTTSFLIDLDTTLFTAFSVPASPRQYAQVVPIADKDDNTFPAPVHNALPYTTP